jgi:hypothetical protein
MAAAWLEEVADFEIAKLRVKELSESVPGEYFIFSLSAGHRLDLREDEACSIPNSATREVTDDTKGMAAGRQESPEGVGLREMRARVNQ